MINSDKATLRQSALKRQAALSEYERSAMSISAARRVLALKEYINAKTVMVYSAFGTEIDPSIIADAAICSGKRVCYPVVINSLDMVAASPLNETAWKRGPFGILEPLPARSEIIQGDKIDLAIVPGVAFDEYAHRLGRGKGYYDRFLKGSGAYRIGFAYECQIVDRIDVSGHDERMNAVVTDFRLIMA